MTYLLDDATSLFKQDTLGDNVFDQPESFLSKSFTPEEVLR